MAEINVRRPRFNFSGDDIPFNWNPERPAFAMRCNFITMFGPAFEKFIVDATREAIPLIRDPDVVEEADLFLRQEAQHSAAHVKHFNALVRRWPGLQETMDAVNDSFAHLTATKPLAWRLGYVAALEATFTPYFKVFLDHEDKVLAPGDERVASLFIWHFCEEMEHRTSAIRIYRAVHDSYLYRLKAAAGVVRHVGAMLAVVSDGFQRHVPAEDGGGYGRLLPKGLFPNAIRDVVRATSELTDSRQATYAGVPKQEMLAMLAGLVRCQAPNHDPAVEPLPRFIDGWFDRYDEDPASVANWYSVGVGAHSSAPPAGVE